MSGVHFFNDIFARAIFEERQNSFVEQIAGVFPIELRTVVILMAAPRMVNIKSCHQHSVVFNNSPRRLQV